MTYENKLKRLIELKSDSVRAFAIEADIPYTTLRSILERGIMKANVENVFKIAEYLGMKPEQLASLDDMTFIIDEITEIILQLEKSRQETVYIFSQQQLSEQNKVVSIEETQTVYLNSKLSAGTGILDLDPSDTKEIEYKGFVPKHDLAFQISGDSMEPLFENGEIVFVEKTPDIHNGQFIAVQINEEAYIKKAYIEDDRLRLVSLNRDYEDIIANGNDDIRVIGRIIL